MELLLFMSIMCLIWWNGTWDDDCENRMMYEMRIDIVMKCKLRYSYEMLIEIWLWNVDMMFELWK
jgi:hypothetical protein